MTIKMIFKCNLGPAAPQVTGHETKKNFKTNFGAGAGGELAEGNQEKQRRLAAVWGTRYRKGEEGVRDLMNRENNKQIHGNTCTLTNKQ